MFLSIQDKRTHTKAGEGNTIFVCLCVYEYGVGGMENLKPLYRTTKKEKRWLRSLALTYSWTFQKDNIWKKTAFTNS